MTIAEAAREVLSKANRPMTVDEIYQEIVKEGLAEFKAAHPQGVLRNQIRRRCEGVPQSSSVRDKLFAVDESGKYRLLNTV